MNLYDVNVRPQLIIVNFLSRDTRSTQAESSHDSLS